jgi:N-acetylglucosamine-6-phosphate deacetylase
MKENNKLYKIINAKLLRDHQLVENDYLWFQNGKFVDGKRVFFEQALEPDEVIDADGAVVAPGFLDLQINGSYGIDFADHEGSDEKLQKDIDTVAKGLLQDGCTSFCPTVVTSKPEVYSKASISNSAKVDALKKKKNRLAQISFSFFFFLIRCFHF